VSGGIEPFLSAGLEGLETSAGDPDWAGVRRRARQLVARRRALRLGATALVGLAAVLAVTPALGLQGRVERLFSSGKPAPQGVIEDFAQLNVAAPPGMAPGVIAGQAREVLEVPLSTGESAVLRVAPTRAGGFCLDLSTSGPAGAGGGGCDSRRSLQLNPGLSIPGPFSPDGRVLQPPVVLDGDTLSRGAATVEIRFEDGEVASAPVTWVSAPLDAGFFVYEVPKNHWSTGHRPSALIVHDAGGRDLSRTTGLPWPFPVTDPRLSGGERHGVSVFTTQAGVREEWALPSVVRLVTIGTGRSRAVAVFTFRPATSRTRP
jgi:hypothetical protein